MAHNLMTTDAGAGSSIRSNGFAIDLMRDRNAMTGKPLGAGGLPALAGRRAPSIHDIWFEQDPTPRFILDGDGRIIEANAEGRGLMARGIVGAGGMLLCTAHRDRPRLDQALKRVSQGRQPNGRVLVRGQDDTWCLIKLLGAEEMNGRVAAAMRRTADLTADRIEPIRAVFGLTPVETQVLMHIVLGDAPKEVARELSMSIFTVRTHLRTIFMKMGVRGITGTLRQTLQLAL